jgi:hypothetical protein
VALRLQRRLAFGYVTHPAAIASAFQAHGMLEVTFIPALQFRCA